MYYEQALPFPPDIEGQDHYYKSQISQELGVPFDQINKDELLRLMEHMRRIRVASDGNILEQKYLSLNDQNNPWGFTRAQYQIDALTDNPMCGISYGTYLPFYKKVLTDYKSGKTKDDHNAMLAGAMCSVSMNEFAVTVKSVYPNAQCVSFDVSATDKQEVSKPGNEFKQVNLLQMSEYNKFDSIHTSCILDYLLDPLSSAYGDSSELSKKRRRFFSRAKNALKPGGILIMAEQLIATSALLRPQDQPYFQELREAGFKGISMHTLQGFKNRRLLDQYFLGTCTEVPNNFIEEDKKLIGITAHR